MPRTITRTVYDKEDYDALEDMSLEEVVRNVESIDRSYLGKSKYYGQDNYEGDEIDYDLYMAHKALHKAIQILKTMTVGG